MDNCKERFNNFNVEKQKILDQIKSSNNKLNLAEDALLLKIKQRKEELLNLKKEYINVMGMYGHIIDALVTKH